MDPSLSHPWGGGVNIKDSKGLCFFVDYSLKYFLCVELHMCDNISIG